MSHLRQAIMEEHRVSMEAYNKVYNGKVRSELRMAIVQQSMKIDMWEIKEKLAERREQMAIRTYEEEKRRAELNQKIEEDKRRDQSRIPEKDVPSHRPRKQHMGGHIFGAGLELTGGFNLRAFEELNFVLGMGQERRTWNPGSLTINQEETF
uniref:Uncharacterized protein n=1 Tax=Tanacetum cinerariifolium TaxID=118510 RepID=A0A699I9I8_TANCI|nr:hypothetical protein [Tanacetum cinerariifolium]